MESRVIRMLDRTPTKAISEEQVAYDALVEGSRLVDPCVVKVVRQVKDHEKGPRPRKETRGVLLGTKEVTRKQYEILLLTLQYKTVGDIARELRMNNSTVSMLKARMVAKFGSWLEVVQLAAARERKLLGKEPEVVSYLSPDELRSSAGYRMALVDVIGKAMDPSITKENLIKILQKQVMLKEGASLVAQTT